MSVCVCVCMCVCVFATLTGTLGSETAMLSGYTVAFTHWGRAAAKRYGSSARSQRSLWEHLHTHTHTHTGKKEEEGREMGLIDDEPAAIRAVTPPRAHGADPHGADLSAPDGQQHQCGAHGSTTSSTTREAQHGDHSMGMSLLQPPLGSFTGPLSHTALSPAQ